MKNRIKLFLAVLCIFILAGSINVYAEGFSISQKKATMNIGDSLELQVSGTDKKPVWISYNENIAKVDQNGTVTAVRKGKTTIKARAGFMTNTCVINVVDSSIKLNKKTATIYHGGTSTNKIQLKATVKGATKNVIWESSDTNIATVDTNGKVTSVSEGTATITATANGKNAGCTVTVKESNISLNMDTMQLSNKGTGSSMKLTPVIIGSKKAVKWTSSDKTIATVSSGKVTGKKSGTVTITATANGVSDTCVVTVTDGLISINEEKILLYVGGTKAETKKLKTNAGKKDITTWNSSNESIASVDNGLVTAKGEGTAVISVNCNGKTDTCTVTVKNTTTEIKENDVFLRTKGLDKSYQLNSSVTGRSNSVKWTTSDKTIAIVNKGKITAKQSGTATITATANGVSDSVTVTVEDYLPTIKLNQGSYVLYINKGNTLTLKATVDGKDKTVSWNSSNKAVATVKSGKVTAVSEGEAIISATANNVTAECLVTVRRSRVILENENLHLNKGEKGNIPVDVIGKSQTIKWSTTNSKVATVKNGVVTAKNYGEADIKVTANGITAICHVNVSECQHNFEEKVTKEATCKEEGIRLYTCTICGYAYTENIPTVEHKWGEWITKKEPTETEMGMQVRTCTVCDMEETSFLPVLEHTHKYEAIVTEPTCTEDGYTVYKCSCGDSYTDNIVPALGHKWGEWQIVQEPTETETGKKKHVCDVCRAEETEEIPNLSHTHEYKAVVTAPTCTEDGYTTYECSCGDSYTSDIVPALGHKWNEWQITKEATETESGEKKHVCIVCGTEETEEIPVLEHVHKYHVANIVEPTCIEQGYAVYECDCGDSYIDDITPVVEHQYTTTVTEPTCTEQGYTTYTCKFCGNFYRDDFVEPVEHELSDWIIEKEPTCTEDGWKVKECINCGCTCDMVILSATGHEFDEGTVIKEATCTENGEKVCTCTKCSATQTEIIEATGHVYGEFRTLIEPSSFETFGKAQMVCPECNAVLFDNMTAVLVDAGNGKTYTSYGYYDYEEARKCFDLTYKYKEENGFLYEGWEYKWDESKYHYSCIRVAEMSYLCNIGYSDTFHNRPNGEKLIGGENLTYKDEAGHPNILTTYYANEALNSWLNSTGHRITLEDWATNTTLAQFTAWIPEWKNWAVFWVQDFYY